MGSGLPTPPREDHGKHHTCSRKPVTGPKPMKPAQRNSKRGINSLSLHPRSLPASDGHPGPSSADGRHRRVWKACERCRMKKTKCDGEFPCKRCKDDGLICTAGTRKKTEYKQIPKGYAEVLENTQFALVATVHKLYAMVRNSEPWELGEPVLNDRGQPVIHNIAAKLGCIRPNNDIDLPVQSAFPEDEAGLSELLAELEAHQKELGGGRTVTAGENDSSCHHADRASSTELDPSDLEYEYRRMAFGGCDNTTTGTLSPQSLTYTDFEARPGSPGALSCHSPTVSTTMFSQWVAGHPPISGPALRAQPSPLAGTIVPRVSDGDAGRSAALDAQFLPQPSQFLDTDLLSQGLLESEFGTLKPHVLSCPNPEVMLGMGDPMICSGYDPESLRL